MVPSVYQRWVLTGSPLRTVGKCKEVGWLVANQQDLSPGPGTTGQHRHGKVTDIYGIQFSNNLFHAKNILVAVHGCAL